MTERKKYQKRERAVPKKSRPVDPNEMPFLVHRQLGHVIKINDMIKRIYQAVMKSDPQTDLINATTLTVDPVSLPYSRGTINYVLDALIDVGLVSEEKRGRTRCVWVTNGGENFTGGFLRLHDQLMGIAASKPKAKRIAKPKPIKAEPAVKDFIDIHKLSTDEKTVFILRDIEAENRGKAVSLDDLMEKIQWYCVDYAYEVHSYKTVLVSLIESLQRLEDEGKVLRVQREDTIEHFWHFVPDIKQNRISTLRKKIKSLETMANQDSSPHEASNAKSLIVKLRSGMIAELTA